MENLSVSRFWDKFTKISIKNGAKKESLLWMVRRAENYIKYYKNDKLAGHSADFVDNYLSVKYRSPLVLDWQFR